MSAAQSMRALVIDQFGGPEALHLADIPRPAPGPGEVLVEIAYASVNPADWKTREGMLSRYIAYEFPFVLGFDLAGVVRDVGPGVANWRIGDRVFGTSKQGQGQNGSYAAFTLANAAMLVPLPPNISMAEAAGLPTAGITAYGGLVDVGALKAGQSVLINGGAGGVGSIAIQIAKAVGARVAVTCSAGSFAYVEEIGADLAIDYRKDDVTAAVRAWAPDGVDLVLDAVGLGTLITHAAELVRSGGSFVEIETLISSASPEQIAAAAEKGVRIVSNMIGVARLHEHLRGLAALVAQGKVRPPPTEIVPLDQAGAAQIRVKEGHVRGKIALRVGEILDEAAQ
jgi:NADPH:quinone reductase-like Zn-dependent oxidoreductase